MDKWKKEIKIVTIIFSAFFLIIIAGGYYGYYKLDKTLLALDNRLENIKESFKKSITTLEKEITFVESSLETKTNLLDDKITEVGHETEKSTQALSNLIKEVEQQSNIELEKVKKDIQSVSVSAADFSQIVQGVLPSVVSVITEKGKGSGAFIADDGYIVTNNHVIENANSIRVYTYDKKLITAMLVGSDKDIDIAVLKINISYSYLEFDDSADVKVGEKVIALGNPGGLDFTVTEGIVSATDRKITQGVPGYIQIDVPLNPGNSGGPLVNTRGKIIGIINFKVGGGFESLGFAIPSNVAKERVERFV